MDTRSKAVKQADLSAGAGKTFAVWLGVLMAFRLWRTHHGHSQLLKT